MISTTTLNAVLLFPINWLMSYLLWNKVVVFVLTNVFESEKAIRLDWKKSALISLGISVLWLLVGA